MLRKRSSRGSCRREIWLFIPLTLGLSIQAWLSSLATLSKRDDLTVSRTESGIGKSMMDAEDDFILRTTQAVGIFALNVSFTVNLDQEE